MLKGVHTDPKHPMNRCSKITLMTDCRVTDNFVSKLFVSEIEQI